MSDRTRERRKRRQLRNARRGRTARGKPSHRLQAGRTGSVHSKREPSKKPAGLHVVVEFVVPTSIRMRERFG